VSDITQILERVEQGDGQDADELLPLVYDELRRLAAYKMSLQPPGQTLQATALVHEAYLRLLGNEEKRWESRKHFFSAAAEAMRHILIDRARRKLRVRHGEKVEHLPLDEIEITAPAPEETVLQLNDALEELKGTSPEQAEIVKLRFFAGFTEPEIAQILDLSERTVQRQWAYRHGSSNVSRRRKHSEKSKGVPRNLLPLILWRRGMGRGGRLIVWNAAKETYSSAGGIGLQKA